MVLIALKQDWEMEYGASLLKWEFITDQSRLR